MAEQPTQDLGALEQRIAQLEERLQRQEASRGEQLRTERIAALRAMARGLVHDFNNALTPIIGASDFLLTTDLTGTGPEVETLLQSIRAAAENAREMVHSLRCFYSPDEDPEFVTESAEALLREAGETIEERSVSYELDSVPPLNVSPRHLKTAVFCLVENAVEATEPGGTIVLGSKTDGSMGVLEVRDTGCGMDSETLARCVEPFFTRCERKHTGLGLSMTYGIMEKYGGRLEISSEPGAGTRVALVVPQE